MVKEKKKQKKIVKSAQDSKKLVKKQKTKLTLKKDDKGPTLNLEESDLEKDIREAEESVESEKVENKGFVHDAGFQSVDLSTGTSSPVLEDVADASGQSLGSVPTFGAGRSNKRNNNNNKEFYSTAPKNNEDRKYVDAQTADVNYEISSEQSGGAWEKVQNVAALGDITDRRIDFNTIGEVGQVHSNTMAGGHRLEQDYEARTPDKIDITKAGRGPQPLTKNTERKYEIK